MFTIKIINLQTNHTFKTQSVSKEEIADCLEILLKPSMFGNSSFEVIIERGAEE